MGEEDSASFSKVAGPDFKFVCSIQVRNNRVVSETSQLERKVLNTVRTKGLLSEGESVVAAVSGGADSVALLHVLARLSGRLKIGLSAGHVNHQLRGADAEADEAFVKELCETLGIPSEVRRAHGLRREGGGNLENEARKVRYDLLAEIARPKNAVIATAHTLNDQAETFLMKLLRGAGPAGLSGIMIERMHEPEGTTLSTAVRVIRPLIEVSRTEILEYLERSGVQFREDAMNDETTFDRNWVRHNLIPLLESRFNPQLVSVLARSANLFAEADEFLQQEAEKVLQDCARSEGEDLLLPVEVLGGFSSILSKQLVRACIRETKGDLESISQQHVDDVLSLIRKTSGRHLDLPGRLVVTREFDWLRFHRREPTPPVFRYQIEVPGEIRVKEVRKTLIVSKWPEGSQTTPSIFLKTGQSLVFRSRQPGDRYQVSPRSPVKTLKKWFIEYKIPRKRRDSLVICESRGEIVWVEGLPPRCQFNADAPETSAFSIEVQNETF